ncbi:MAG: hypothetical protein JO168_16320 [Solirubrobacterales bacterium]|nr:hypothetical protein [Solirubrobacterales bacterium]MBV9716168.1 hypothetical protein [Solirubrobacterales bacterium]
MSRRWARGGLISRALERARRRAGRDSRGGHGQDARGGDGYDARGGDGRDSPGSADPAAEPPGADELEDRLERAQARLKDAVPPREEP